MLYTILYEVLFITFYMLSIGIPTLGDVLAVLTELVYYAIYINFPEG